MTDSSKDPEGGLYVDSDELFSEEEQEEEAQFSVRTSSSKLYRDNSISSAGEDDDDDEAVGSPNESKNYSPPNDIYIRVMGQSGLTRKPGFIANDWLLQEASEGNRNYYSLSSVEYLLVNL